MTVSTIKSEIHMELCPWASLRAQSSKTKSDYRDSGMVCIVTSCPVELRLSPSTLKELPLRSPNSLSHWCIDFSPCNFSPA